jgi:hypothetical protein
MQKKGLSEENKINYISLALLLEFIIGFKIINFTLNVSIFIFNFDAYFTKVGYSMVGGLNIFSIFLLLLLLFLFFYIPFEL